MRGKQVLVGVSGGIAAYKSCELVTRLVKAGAEVHVIMTEHGQKFVGRTTFQALSGRPVITDLFGSVRSAEIEHISLSDGAELTIVAPATANVLGKVAGGIADDILTTTIMACHCPVLLAPAMNSRMWENPIVQQNVRVLQDLGYEFVGPEYGRLASGAEGLGRMSEPADIFAAAEQLLARTEELAGATVLVTAGPTWEWLDPVRFISNRSTGKMGFAVAEAAVRRGAHVILVTGPTELSPPPDVECVAVTTAAEMATAALELERRPDIAICAAAVGDFRAARRAEQKIKRSSGPVTLELVPNVDILAELGKREIPVLVGFAAETEKLAERAQEKLRAKGCDLLVANDVSAAGAGFAGDTNVVTLYRADGSSEDWPQMSKRAVAVKLMDEVVALWRKRLDASRRFAE